MIIQTIHKRKLGSKVSLRRMTTESSLLKLKTIIKPVKSILTTKSKTVSRLMKRIMVHYQSMILTS